MKKVLAAALVGIFLAVGNCYAEPLIWETDFGDVLNDLTGNDDSETSVNLSFNFPFDGTDYTTVYVGTNGALQLGSLGDDSEIDYDVWEYMEQFLSDSAPLIAPFETDLDLGTTGTIHFNDFGDRAVFTWNEVGTNSNETRYCQMLCMALGGDPVFNNAINKFYPLNYFSKSLRMMQFDPSFLCTAA